jgi:hypothetical protein
LVLEDSKGAGRPLFHAAWSALIMSVGVAADLGRHDGGIDNPQPLHAMNFQPRIDHGHFVGAHPAGADRVIDGVGALADIRAQIIVAQTRIGIDIALAVGLHGRSFEDLAGHFHSGQKRVFVPWIRQELRIDARRLHRVGVLQADVPA